MCSRQRPVFMAEGRIWERGNEDTWERIITGPCASWMLSDSWGQDTSSRREDIWLRGKHGNVYLRWARQWHVKEVTPKEVRQLAQKTSGPGRQICLAWKPIRSTHNTAFNSCLVETGTVGWGPSQAPHLVLSTKQDTDTELPKSLSY